MANDGHVSRRHKHFNENYFIINTIIEQCENKIPRLGIND